jgi:Phosphatidylethanolamine-binding protein
VAEFSLTSSAFAHEDAIPRRHTCDGEDRSPPLWWSAPPAGTRSLVLILDDPDAPGGRFIHWLVWGITPDAGGLAEGELAPLEGRNDFGTVGYRGPCPPRGLGRHIPREMLSSSMRRIGEVLPLAPVVTGLRDAWSGTGISIVALAALTAMVVVASAVGVRVFR